MNKSLTCKGIKGKPLNEYDSDIDALQDARFLQEKYDTEWTPYKCEKCARWHLSPKNRSTPSRHCSVCNKEAYETKKGAEKRADFIHKERSEQLQGGRLSVYRCPADKGWHLTSR